ncbi:MAG: cytochrome P450 [Solirubrobacteraceae bacterium]
MSATTQQTTTSPSTAAAEQWSARVEPSAAGPAPQDGSPIALPPAVRLPRALQQLRFSMRQSSFFLRSSQKLGQTFRMRGVLEDDWVTVTSHPDHVRSLFTADPDLAPSLTGESPLRPIVGPNSVLTLLGPKHMRQRKLLLPPFHGEAIERYTQMIEDAAQREIESWPIGEPFVLGTQMQAVTLEVIMSGIFGVEGLPPKGTLERELRDEIHRIVGLSTRPFAILAEMVLLSRENPGKVVSGVMQRVDELLYALIAERREAAGADDGRTDILSLLLAACDEEGVPMSDEELRDELITLVLAGHETTANSLAWAFERLLRNPGPYARLRELVRASGLQAQVEADAYVEAVIHETMRVRPVVPSIGRRVSVPWQLGRFRVPAGTPVVMSIVLLHHREDVYPQPFAFAPERFVDAKPGTYTWIPFGGGIRRCLGATLAMAEQRVVLRAIATRTDMRTPDASPEKLRHRNVTMVPSHGTRVILDRRLPA